ncbi:MAG: SulP family sulfate permease [Gammaproteobacteria bacterium]
MKFVNGLHFNNIRGDIYGGLTAAVVALPLAMAFGVSSGAGPIAGLYGAIFVGFFAALFGGTPAQISGPTGPMTVVMAAIFTQYTALDPINGAAMAFTVVIMGGLFQILFGVLRIGKYINYVPQSVISGFMSGIGVIIILLQLAPLLGTASASNTIDAIKLLPAAVSNINFAAFLLGLLTLAIVYFTPKKFGKIVPPMLLALLIGTLAATFLLSGKGVTILGDLPTGFPDLRLPVIDAAMLPSMIKSALILALLGTIDSLLTSLVADNMTRSHHQSDRELIGQGIGNTVAGLFGGLPGAGATMRTVVNVRTGGQTPISGMLHAVVLLSIVLGLGSAAKYIPHVVLAGLLIKVGTDIIDWGYLKRIGTSSKAGITIMFTVLLMTVFVDLIMAVAVGMAMASVLFLKRQSDRQLDKLQVIRASTGTKMVAKEEAQILNTAGDRLVVFDVGGPLSFGAAKDMVRQFSNETNYQSMVLDLQAVSALDYTAICAVKDVIEGAQDQGVTVSVVMPDEETAALLKREGSLSSLSADQVFTNRLAALQSCAKVSV